MIDFKDLACLSFIAYPYESSGIMETAMCKCNLKNSEINDELKLHQIDLNLFPIFMAVMKEMKITLAAERISMSQPGISNAIIRLKSIVNDELFTKKGRCIEPTPRAIEIFYHVCEAMSALQKTLPHSISEQEKRQDNFSILITSPLHALLSPLIIAGLKKSAPNITFNVNEVASNEIELESIAKKHDFTLSYENLNKNGFISIPLFNG